MGIQNGTGKRRHLIPEEKFPNGMKVCSIQITSTLFALTLSYSGGGCANRLTSLRTSA
jgi:hypothetical protein